MPGVTFMGFEVARRPARALSRHKEGDVVLAFGQEDIVCEGDSSDVIYRKPRFFKRFPDSAVLRSLPVLEVPRSF